MTKIQNKKSEKNPIQNGNKINKYINKQISRNLNKEVKDHYNENCKTLKSEIEEDTERQKDLLRSWIRRFTTVKIDILPNQSTVSMQ